MGKENGKGKQKRKGGEKGGGENRNAIDYTAVVE